MLRPLLVLALALSGCRQPPPEVRPAPPRQPAFGEASRIGISARDAGPTTGGGSVAWVQSRGASLAELAILAPGKDSPTLHRVAADARFALDPVRGELACSATIPPSTSNLPELLLDGLLDRRLTGPLLVRGPWSCLNPSWSPDGKQIVFEISDHDVSRLWIVDVQLPERTYLAEGSDPAWSPEGARIAYVSGADLWTVRPDGTDPKPVTSGLVARSPSWSPDGRWIAFARPDAAGRPDDLWAAAADGSRCVRLTWDPAGEWDPCWAPDGRLYFVSDRGGETALWVASPVNKELLR